MTANSFRSWFRKLIGQSRVCPRKYLRTILYVDGSHLIRIAYQREFTSPCAIAQYIACFIDHSLDIFKNEYEILHVKVYFDGILPTARLVRHAHRMRTTLYPIVGTTRVAEVLAYLKQYYPRHHYYTSTPGEATMQIVTAVINDVTTYPLICASEIPIMGGLIFRHHYRASIYDPLARRPFTLQTFLHYCYQYDSENRTSHGVARDFIFLTTFMGSELIPLNPYITNPLKLFKAIWSRYQLLIKSDRSYLLDSHNMINWRSYFKLLQIIMYIEETFLIAAKPSDVPLGIYLTQWYPRDTVPMNTRCNDYLQYLQWVIHYYSNQTSNLEMYYPLEMIPTIHHLYLYLNRRSVIPTTIPTPLLPIVYNESQLNAVNTPFVVQP